MEGCAARNSKKKTGINQNHPLISRCEMAIEIEYQKLFQLYMK